MKKFMICALAGVLALSAMACSSKETKSLSASEEKYEVEESDDSIGNESSIGIEDINGNKGGGGTDDGTATTQYALGDIILADGSVISVEDFTDVDEGNFPIAVIAGYREDGTAFGVGVHRSDTPLQWAADDSSGYAIGFTENVSTQDSGSGFSGDLDGSDNWNVICSQDEGGTADAATNYPAFYYISTYAATYELTGEYASGWYMPSIAELCDIYENRETVNRSLKKIYALDGDAAMEGLDTNWYWSSSQSGSADDYEWFVHYFNGYAGECPKNFTNVHALAVRAF